MAVLSIRQERWDDDDASLSNTHAQKTFVHAFDEVALPQVGVIGFIPRVTRLNTGEKKKLLEKHKKQKRDIYTLDNTAAVSPGVEGLTGQQGAVIVVTHKI